MKTASYVLAFFVSLTLTYLVDSVRDPTPDEDLEMTQ